MRLSRFPGFVGLILSTLLLWTYSAGVQRIETVGVRPPGQPAMPAFAVAMDEAIFLTASVASLSLEHGGPSLWKHLAVGTMVGTVVPLVVGITAVKLTCNNSCEWAGLSVLISTAIGAGAGFVIGGVVYVVKRVID